MKYFLNTSYLLLSIPGGGGGGGPRANTTLYGDFMGDLNDYFTLEVGEMREVWFPKALHQGENRGLCKQVTSLCSSFTNVFNLLFACKFLPCDNILDSNSRQYCGTHSVKVQANTTEVQPEEERGRQWYCV